MTEHVLRERLRSVYVDGIHDLVLVERIEGVVEHLRARIASLLSRPAVIHDIPGDVNYYYTIECCLTEGCPPFHNELVLMDDNPERAEYLQLWCSVVVPVIAGVWHGFRAAANGTFEHVLYDFYSDDWLRIHPEHEPVVLELEAAAEQVGISLIGWDVLLEPSAPEWPPQPFAPQESELRHYVFPGFYEDWGGVSKPVRDDVGT